jgi:hypothetical protein|tara:strand:+ start:829 stop:1089 length:261 start_codon:yes stop_codon:yes gene_type:complete
MSGELSERIVRRAARIAARETMLVRAINERFGYSNETQLRDQEFSRIARKYNALPDNINNRGWTPFTLSTIDATRNIIEQSQQGGQ